MKKGPIVSSNSKAIEQLATKLLELLEGANQPPSLLAVIPSLLSEEYTFCPLDAVEHELLPLGDTKVHESLFCVLAPCEKLRRRQKSYVIFMRQGQRIIRMF